MAVGETIFGVIADQAIDLIQLNLCHISPVLANATIRFFPLPCTKALKFWMILLLKTFAKAMIDDLRKDCVEQV